MASMKQTKVKQLRRALNEEKAVAPTPETRIPEPPTRLTSKSKQLNAGRQAAAASKNASSASTAKSRAAAVTQVAKSTASSSVNRKAVKKAEPAAAAAATASSGAVTNRGLVTVRKAPASPQSSQAAIRHGNLLSETNIQRSDTITVRAKNLTKSSPHRPADRSDQREERCISPDQEDERDALETHVQEGEQEELPDEYSDDFDDYESDFEAEDEEEGRKVVETDDRPEKVETKEERQEMAGQQGNSYATEGKLIRDEEAEERHKERISITSGAGIIDPDVTEIRQQKQQQLSSSNSNSRSKRQRDLLSVIKLNAVTYQIYSHPGISYDVYMRMFGRKNHRQFATQTCERQDQSIQSEMILMKEGWTQHPFYSLLQQQDKPFCQSNCRTSSSNAGDPFRLLAFLTRSHKILNILIKDSNTRNQSPHFPDSALRTKSARRVMKLPAGSEKFCAQFHKLIGMTCFKKFPVSVIRAESSCQLVISVQVNPLTDESFLLIWPGSRACRPDHVLHTRSPVTCCFWAGDDRVVAGTRDGSLLLWDWHSERSGSQIDVESGSFVPREPAFASSCVTSLDVHQSRIVSIDGMDAKSGSCNPDQGSRRIVVVDEQALISFWIVEVVVVKQSEMGEGMFPGSKCTLLLEARTRIDALSRVTCLCSAQDEAGCFFVGTDTGVIHETSQSAATAITYSQIRDSQETGEDSALSAVSCISLNPENGNLFLASFDDGTISLFRRSASSPGTHLMTWDSTDTQIGTATTVLWLPSCASAFVALSASSSLVFWDLDTCLWNPLFKYQLTKVTCMSVTEQKDAGIAFGTEDGNMEIMTLTTEFRTRKDLTQLMEKLMND